MDALAREGVFVDFRVGVPGGDAGVMRLSSTAASFDYELRHALERLAALAAG